jgi:hypothetical protein
MKAFLSIELTFAMYLANCFSSHSFENYLFFNGIFQVNEEKSNEWKNIFSYSFNAMAM